jgi:hypothetical protein
MCDVPSTDYSHTERVGTGRTVADFTEVVQDSDVVKG